jgi:hypothetical protein
MKTLKERGKTESQLYSQIKNIMGREGDLVRLENMIVPGLPDMIYIYSRVICLIENKVCRSGKISMPIFQWSRANMMMNDINPDHHWYFVMEETGVDDIIAAYRFLDMCHLSPITTVEGVVKLNIQKAIPKFIFYNPSDIYDWLEYVRGTRK